MYHALFYFSHCQSTKPTFYLVGLMALETCYLSSKDGGSRLLLLTYVRDVNGMVRRILLEKIRVRAIFHGLGSWAE